MIEEIKKEIEDAMWDDGIAMTMDKLFKILDKYNNQHDYKTLYFNIIKNAVNDFYERTKDVKEDWLGYIALDCPNCGRRRVEIVINKIICEKCNFELINIQELEQKYNIGSDKDVKD